MDNVLEKTGKTVDEALQAALDELGVTVDHVQYEVIEEAGKKGLFGLFGSKQARVKVWLSSENIKTTPEPAGEKPIKDMDTTDVAVAVADPGITAKEFLQKVFACMSLDVAMEKFVNSEGTVTLNLHGPDLGLLIGKHGQTLDALQYLTGLVANKNSDGRVRIVIDVEDYRKRRAETLTRLAMRLADKAKRREERVVLEPMNPHERKVIHMALQDDRHITTYSEGEEPHRYIVIAPKR